MPDLEIIAVDDASTDGTAECVRRHSAVDPRIRLITLPDNRGHGGASREAVRQATGDWVTMLDADDWYDPERLAVLLKAAGESNADVVIDNLKIFDHSLGRVIERTRHGQGRDLFSLTFLDLVNADNPTLRNPIGYVKPMIRRAYLQSTGLNYRGVYRSHEDFVLLAELILGGGWVVLIPSAHYVYVRRAIAYMGQNPGALLLGVNWMQRRLTNKALALLSAFQDEEDDDDKNDTWHEVQSG